VHRLEELVNHDSPSDGAEQEWIAERIAEWLAPAGCTARWVAEPDGPARSMVVTLTGDGGPMVALLGHTDTVFPVGTAAARPFRREGDRCFGPGVADMKGGVLLAVAAMERLAAAPSRPFAEVRLLACADEETRLRAPAVCAEADGAAAAMVFECARENGDLVAERKGAIWRTLRLHGRPAHAGADTHRGRSAVSALAQEIVRIEALASGRPEMTSVITTVRGGDSANTVPGESFATIDIRSSIPEDLVFALAELGRDGAYDGVTGEIEDRGTWPPMPRTPWLVDLARTLADGLGLEVGEQHSGGVSDGCWTGDVGIATIDGLGPVGGDDHTAAEWIEIETLEARIELAARLVESVAQRGA
jgi:glutamate carboxypeptidase